MSSLDLVNFVCTSGMLLWTFSTLFARFGSMSIYMLIVLVTLSGSVRFIIMTSLYCSEA